ncbi:MAG: flagellar basal body protein [Proteobacteria bacterium]|nr:flagellar basal body protein [Pseudomonadota bacterium]
MAMFAAFQVAGSGLLATRKWLDAVSDNISNLNTARRTDEAAFQSRMIVAQAENYGGAGGVRVAGVVFGNAEGRLMHSPDHPLADENGMVRMPDMDLSDQMTQLMIAQRGYQANISVVERAKDAYQAALRLGQR